MSDTIANSLAAVVTAAGGLLTAIGELQGSGGGDGQAIRRKMDGMIRAIEILDTALGQPERDRITQEIRRLGSPEAVYLAGLLAAPGTNR